MEVAKNMIEFIRDLEYNWLVGDEDILGIDK